MKIETRVGRARWDGHDFMGFDVFSEIADRCSLTQMLVLSVGGPKLAPKDLAVIDALAGALLAADPRIWPLKIARVGSSNGSAMTGIISGALIFDNINVGPFAILAAAQFLRRLSPHRDDTELRRHVMATTPLPGFGTPARTKDERLAPFLTAAAKYGVNKRPHWKLYERVAKIVETERQLPLNIALPAAAALTDMGLEPKAVGIVSYGLLQIPQIANAFEGSTESFLRALPDEFIRYVGPKARRSPRAQRHEGRRSTSGAH